jgi:Spy/CpxP family protein refolding chaperone
MKRSIHAALAAAVLLTGLCAPRLRADDGDKKSDKDGRKAEWAAKRQEHLKKKLDLTDDQAAKLAAAFKAERETMKPLREKSKETSKALRELVRNKASDKDISAALDKQDAARKAAMAERQKFQASLDSILKPTQRAKLRLMREKMMHRRMAMGRRWGRRGRGGDRCEGGRGKDGDRGHDRGDDEKGDQ